MRETKCRNDEKAKNSRCQLACQERGVNGSCTYEDLETVEHVKKAWSGACKVAHLGRDENRLVQGGEGIVQLRAQCSSRLARVMLSRTSLTVFWSCKIHGLFGGFCPFEV